MDKPLKGKARAKKLRDLIRQVGLTCGAHCRTTGKPCRKPPHSLTVGNGRCYMHSGKGDSAPKTPEGQRRSIEAARAGYRRWRDRQLAIDPLGYLDPLE